MTHTIVMLRGIPAAGKSTWSRAWLETHPEYQRVSKDDLRLMTDGGRRPWSEQKEAFILAVRDSVIATLLSHGYSVVVDDTNIRPIHQQHLRRVAQLHQAVFRIVDLSAPVEVCIMRDALRDPPQRVGEARIREMDAQLAHVLEEERSMREALRWVSSK